MTGISVYIPRPKHIETVDSYETAYDPTLFLEHDGVIKGTIRSIKDAASALMAELRGDEEVSFNDMLDGLVAASINNEEWPHWRYRNEDRGVHRPRTFTPPFARESYGAGILLSRLQVIPAARPWAQSIIHIEKIKFGDGPPETFSGQEIVWSPGSDRRPFMNIGTGHYRYNVSPEKNKEFWHSAMRMITAAHAEFVEA